MFKRTNYRFGFDIWGVLLFLFIMIPNFIWFKVPACNDVLRQDSVTPILDSIAAVAQIIMVAALCIVINKEQRTSIGRPLFIGILLAVGVYYMGWILYYNGMVNAYIILDLSIAPCVAFLLFSFARKNGIALASGSLFMVCHVVYSVVNFVLN